MKVSRVILIVGILLLGAGSLFAQAPAEDQSILILPPQAIIFGAEQQEFIQNMKDINFALDNCECSFDNAALSANVEWLKAHPNVRFYVNGYADVRGDTLYNVNLSQKRADAVKAALIRMGIPEDRIVVAAGWGEGIGVCNQNTEDCFAQNRRVRLKFATVQPAMSASSN